MFLTPRTEKSTPPPEQMIRYALRPSGRTMPGRGLLKYNLVELTCMTRLMKADKAARILDVPRDRVYEMAVQGLLPVVRLSRQVRFDEAKLRDWIDDGGKALSGGWRARPR